MRQEREHEQKQEPTQEQERALAPITSDSPEFLRAVLEMDMLTVLDVGRRTDARKLALALGWHEFTDKERRAIERDITMGEAVMRAIVTRQLRTLERAEENAEQSADGA